MLPFKRPSTFYLTASTPSTLTYEQDISPKHTLNVHDLDGEGREWVVQASVAKVSIYNSRNLTLRLPGRIVTSTVDIWRCENLEIVVDCPLATLQLDPILDQVRIVYSRESHVGRIVLSPTATSDRSESGLKNVSFRVGDEPPFQLADEEGKLRNPEHLEGLVRAEDEAEEEQVQGDSGRQWVLSRTEVEGGGRRWRLDGLTRGAMNYPVY